MEEVILLLTDYSEDYWHHAKSAPFKSRQYNLLNNWDKLVKSCPLPGIGIYMKTRRKNCINSKFVYIKIKGMSYDITTLEPKFDFDVIKDSNIQSKLLLNLLPHNINLFSSKNSEEIIQILKNLNSEPPEEWLKLLNITNSQIIVPQVFLTNANNLVSDWKKYIGKYFIELLDNNISNVEFEDRIAVLLKSLGFFVDKKGHEKYGEYPDGIAFHEKIGIVYDCKNRVKYFPTAEDSRAMNKYLSDEESMRNDKKLYPVFIAKSFNHTDNKYFYFTVESLLYLLYKKLTLGPGFTLNPFNKLFTNKSNLTTEIINNEWY